jgi:hypothetical protein
MSETVSITRKIFGKNSFTTVVDTSISQLIPVDTTKLLSQTQQVSAFFDTYNSIFYDIPTTGSVGTHLELVNRSSEYLGISYQDLLTELTTTRQENVALKNQIFVLTGV